MIMFCKLKGITMQNHFKYVFILRPSVFDYLGMCTTHVLGWGEAVQSLFHWSLSHGTCTPFTSKRLPFACGYKATTACCYTCSSCHFPNYGYFLKPH